MKWTITSVCLIILFPLFSVSQNVGIGTASPVARLHVTDSNVVFSAPEVTALPSSFNVPVSGSGSRLLWLPVKSAFRAGTVGGNEWDADSIGTWSFAGGRNNVAVGSFSAAFGSSNAARGSNSFVAGSLNIASGPVSVAMGNLDTASGISSSAFGFGNHASGTRSFVAGFRNRATNTNAIAVGSGNLSAGQNSFTAGIGNTASGTASLAAGSGSEATGEYAVSTGLGLSSRAYASMAAGAYNDSVASSSTNIWVATDPLFYIGNGTALARHNALVVYKNGMLLLKNPAAVTTDPGVIPLPVNGPGTRMMWIPEKSAFRAGTVVSSQWDADSIGTWSVATGRSTRATGPYSFASGFGSLARGNTSTAMGSIAQALDSNAVAIGSSVIASGINSLAMGFGSQSNGISSVAIGNTNRANGDGSIVFGLSSRADGDFSQAFGRFNIASGAYASVTGNDNTARAYNSFVIGRNSDSVITSNPLSWVPTDPLFVIGNGITFNNRHNTLVVYKNGNMVLKNPATVIADPVGYTTPVSGAGTRMMWLPEKSAFRAGTVDATQWDAANIGVFSFAAGANTNAYGNNSTALGYGTTALGSFSTAFGYYTTAFSGYSTAMGFMNVAKSFASVVMGRYNDSIVTSNPNSWVNTDPLFMIGNGAADNARSNAMVVYKNGNTDINGFTQLGETAPAIKMKELSVNLSGTAGVSTFVAHGVTASKIISVSGLATVGGFQILPNHSQTGFQYWLNVDIANIAVTPVAGNSANVLNAPVKILVIYRE